MVDEIDTIGTRPQDPFYISEEDKKIMREELFPFWKGKSVDEYCEDQYTFSCLDNGLVEVDLLNIIWILVVKLC